MNIFVLNLDPVIAAQEQCNAHVVKMIVESAQMLSTAHRILDGKIVYDITSKGRKITRYRHESLDDVLYKSVQVNHPSTKWTCESKANYNWHYEHFIGLCNEYTFRYNKIHDTQTKLMDVLSVAPNNIPDVGLTNFKLAMKSNPECMKECPVESYRRYYTTKRDRFSMVWSKRDVPAWFTRYSNEG